MSNISYIIIIIISLIFSAFFSGMEIAFITANRLKVEMDKKQGGIIAYLISIFIKNPSQYIATMLVGNNVALVIYGIFFAKVITLPLQNLINVSEYAILFIQTVLSAIIILITAEFLPKTVFRRNANSFLNIFSIPVAFFYIVFYPISRFSVFISETIIHKIFKIKTNKKNSGTVFGKIDISDLIHSNVENQSNIEEENEMKFFKNALDFSEITIRDCMIPRNEIVAVSIDTPISTLKNKFIETGFSKILIYEESIDNVIAYVHTMSLLKGIKNIEQAMTNIPAIPETMFANEVLQELTKKKKSVALVLDEFGGTSGMVTVEDIIEEIFGEIEDEHDRPELLEKQISKDEYLFAGRLETNYINNKYNLGIPEAEEYDTLSGYILHLTKQIPTEGQIIEATPFKFIIKKTDLSKILAVQLYIEQ